MQRRMVDTARQSDRRLWEDLAARAVGIPVPYRPARGIAVYHIRMDDYLVMTAEHDLAGPLLDLVTAVMAQVPVERAGALELAEDQVRGARTRWARFPVPCVR